MLIVRCRRRSLHEPALFLQEALGHYSGEGIGEGSVTMTVPCMMGWMRQMY
jgi:hypothetical protein